MEMTIPHPLSKQESPPKVTYSHPGGL
ncbi:MAG: hypothetical protein RL749_1092, partial [Verrucomicrobiota bacterium]